MAIPPLQTSGGETGRLKKVSIGHDALIDAMIANPMVTYEQLSDVFGYSEKWISRLVNSDSFQSRLAQRKDLIVTPIISQTVESRMKALTSQSIDILMDKLDETKSPQLALKVLELTPKALGLTGSKGGVNLQQNFVVALPQKEKSSSEWASTYSPLTVVEGE